MEKTYEKYLKGQALTDMELNLLVDTMRELRSTLWELGPTWSLALRAANLEYEALFRIQQNRKH